MNLAKKRDEPPQTGDSIAYCITTGGKGSGLGNIHPSGKRDCTPRELACLQSFPLGHKFGDKEVKKQIGNAVAPVMATAILEEVVKSLKEADGLA